MENYRYEKHAQVGELVQLGRNAACEQVENGREKLEWRPRDVIGKKQYKNTIMCSKDPPLSSIV